MDNLSTVSKNIFHNNKPDGYTTIIRAHHTFKLLDNTFKLTYESDSNSSGWSIHTQIWNGKEWCPFINRNDVNWDLNKDAHRVSALIENYKNFETACIEYIKKFFAKPVIEDETKLKIKDIKDGDSFIIWPAPGDNAGHGGYLGKHILFTKKGKEYISLTSGHASNFLKSMEVIGVAFDEKLIKKK